MQTFSIEMFCYLDTFLFNFLSFLCEYRIFKASFPLCPPTLFIALPSSPLSFNQARNTRNKYPSKKKEDTQPSFEVKSFQLAFDRRTVKT